MLIEMSDGDHQVRKLTVEDVDVRGKRALVRVDFNVTLDPHKRKKILDDFRIEAALPTIEYLIEHGARTILCSHLDRPGGKVVEELRMNVVGERLSERLHRPVAVATDCIGPDVKAAVERLRDGDVLLLENLRFHPGEENNDPEFARELAELAEIYVGDAFATAHREHASIVTVPELRPKVAGLLMDKEIQALNRIVANVERPLGVIFGGAKISDKIEIVRHFLHKADVVVVGGAMANTFLKASGKDVGSSKVEDAWVETAREILQEVDDIGVTFCLPLDVVAGEEAKQGEEEIPPALHRVVDVDEVPDRWRILDVGPRTVRHFASKLESCNMIVWNGPLGRFEWKDFLPGSMQMAEALGKMKAYRVAGGGDTSALHRIAHATNYCDYVSTGGGSFLQFLEGRELPGIRVLEDKIKAGEPVTK